MSGNEARDRALSLAQDGATTKEVLAALTCAVVYVGDAIANNCDTQEIGSPLSTIALELGAISTRLES